MVRSCRMDSWRLSTLLCRTCNSHQSRPRESQKASPKRCSGHNKEKGRQSSVATGQGRQIEYLQRTKPPTLSAHHDQRCGARWSDSHTCYFFKLPLELRDYIFLNLLPTACIGSSTAFLHKTRITVGGAASEQRNTSQCCAIELFSREKCVSNATYQYFSHQPTSLFGSKKTFFQRRDLHY